MYTAFSASIQDPVVDFVRGDGRDWHGLDLLPIYFIGFMMVLQFVRLVNAVCELYRCWAKRGLTIMLLVVVCRLVRDILLLSAMMLLTVSWDRVSDVAFVASGLLILVPYLLINKLCVYVEKDE